MGENFGYFFIVSWSKILLDLLESKIIHFVMRCMRINEWEYYPLVIFVYIESFHLRYDMNIDHIFYFWNSWCKSFTYQLTCICPLTMQYSQLISIYVYLIVHILHYNMDLYSNNYHNFYLWFAWWGLFIFLLFGDINRFFVDCDCVSTNLNVVKLVLNLCNMDFF